MNPIVFVTFLWSSDLRHYPVAQANALARQIRQHYTGPHRFVCITDETERFSKDIELLPTPAEAKAVAHLGSPEGERFPSCYRRLWLFSQAARMLGEKVFLLDLDCLVVGDLRPLTEIPGDFVGWSPNTDWGARNRLGGGTWMLKTGSHPAIWDDFAADPLREINAAHAKGYRGSDQAYISYRLERDAQRWSGRHGIYQRQDGVERWTQLPGDARIIHFNGPSKPWEECWFNRPWVVEAMNYV